MKCKKEWIKDPEWQKVRKDLQGRWRNQEKYCLNQLANFLGPLDKAPLSKLCVVANYLTGTGFRIGRISSNNIQDLRTRVFAQYKIKKMERSK